MNIIGVIAVILYIIGLLFLFLYCMTQLSLVISYYRARKKIGESAAKNIPLKHFPMVTIQLPVYNEMYVVERLIDHVMKFDYPKDKFEVQVLDDSTDETLEISRKKVEEYQKKGFNIELITRPDRKGYKAGALEYGLPFAKGEYIAIFDADFTPEADFLQQTLPYFSDSNVGLVQTRWEHINKSYSILTKVQAFALNAHFFIEQSGRYAAGVFTQFNGTAGVWRRKCIEDAGGWSPDTLTEDLDISFRAQLKGWHFCFVDSIGSPAELPAVMSAIKSQQYRWSKGPAEVTRKMIWDVIGSKQSFKVKWYSIFHLLGSSVNILVLYTAMLSVPLLYLQTQYPGHWVFGLIGVFFVSMLALAVFYLYAQIREVQCYKKGLRNFALLFIPFLSLSMGLSFHNSVGAISGLLGRRSPFVRTPKFNIVGKDGEWKSKKYNIPKIDAMTLGEVFLSIYFLMGILMAFAYGTYGLVLFHGMLFIGFFSISFLSLRQIVFSGTKAASA